jgi:CBS domain-containing protein
MWGTLYVPVRGEAGLGVGAYNRRMRGWSFPLGRFLGVEVRIHAFFALLLGMSISFGSILSGSGSSGLGLWLMLFSAVLVREIARAIVCVWFGLDIRSILLMPTGGLPTFASQDDTVRASSPIIERWLAVAGPLANVLAGVMLFGFIAGVAPEVHLLARPLVSPGALLRSFIWVQVLLGAIHLLPAYPLDGGRILRSELARSGARTASGEGLKRSQQAVMLGQLTAGALIILGWIMNNLIVVMAGLSVFAAAHLEDQGVLLQTKVDSVRMKDVMLTEFSTLSASATLEDALDQAIHTLQDVFPVVRAGNLVGAVSRQGIFEALQTDGNGYVQGVMTRSFHTAQPDDSLLKTLQRITTGHGAQLVPVVEGERVVGIITPQNLSQSMSVLNQSKKLQERNAKAEQRQE